MVASGVELASSRSRAQDVADYLAGQIGTRWAVGDRIGTKNDLRELTGVAVGTINEATRLLQERGWITTRPGPRGGLFAASPDPLMRIGQTLVSVRDQAVVASEASMIRDALEPVVVTNAAMQRTKKDVSDLRGLLAAMGELIKDDEGFVRANWVLHERIAQIGTTHLLANIYLALHGVLKEQLKSVVPNTKTLAYKQERLEIHACLVDAIALGDVNAALHAAHAHTQEAAPATIPGPAQSDRKRASGVTHRKRS
jgi:DNA-binding FadR family transcriptional regulator